ncbi:hypothetical protein GCM10010425_03490 [Streptomyces spororaveus]|uniref:Uncharacterized protein n=1 Tax=Streptomyces spororaveus TaxID=284039 RepID=A0ABQ3TDE6_9ACTN|nr:hypothetical protein Sspor_39280 [Streptomyces spororaveus]
MIGGDAMAGPKCGWRTEKNRPCTRDVMGRTSRCWQHQGKWSAHEAERRRKKAAEEKLKKLRQR